MNNKRLNVVGFAALLALVLAMVGLSGCALVQDLDTENKRVFAAELAVSHALQEVDRRQRAGEYSPDEWRQVKEHLRDLRDARAVIYAVVANDGQSAGALERVYDALTALRPFLEENGDG